MIFDDYSVAYSLTLSDKYEIEDVENRRLRLNDTVDDGVLDTIAYLILRYNRLDENIEPQERQPIILYINSDGGETSAGFGLIDIILNSKTPIYTVNLAKSHSMACLIFLAGDKRYALSHSTFLLHDGSAGLFSSVGKMQNFMDFIKNHLEKETKDFVLLRSKISDEEYDKKYYNDWWFSAQEGKDIGVVDYIIGEDCPMSDVV